MQNKLRYRYHKATSPRSPAALQQHWSTFSGLYQSNNKGIWTHTQGSPRPWLEHNHLWHGKRLLQNFTIFKGTSPEHWTKTSRGMMGHRVSHAVDSLQFRNRDLAWDHLNNNAAKDTAALQRLPSHADLALEEHPGASAAAATTEIKHSQLNCSWGCSNLFCLGALTERATVAYPAQLRRLGRNVSAGSPQWGTVGSGSTHRNYTRTLNS